MLIVNSNLLFKLISVFLVISAGMVTVSNHAVFSLLFLVLCYIFSSFLLFFLECEFLALIFIVVYVGAIAVLFLFAIMMLNTKKNDLLRNAVRYFPTGFVISLSFLIPVVFRIKDVFKNDINNEFLNNLNVNWFDLIDSSTDIEIYGQILYSFFVLQFLVSGLILLVVIIGVVFFTNTYSKFKTMDQSAFKQLSASSKFFY